MKNGETIPGLTPPAAHGLAEIQESFKKYQEQAFEERSASFFALELAGECGELANLEKKAWRNLGKPLELDKHAEEAADVLIALINYCNAREIVLEKAVEKKLVEIERRRVSGEMGRVRSRDYFGE